MIDKKHVGMELPAVVWAIERGRLLAFANAIGEKRPEYVDDAAARAAGHRGLLAPPTFWFAAQFDAGTLMQMLAALEVPIQRILHGEQSFTYHAQVCAGDVLTLKSTVADIVEKKGGTMELITTRTTVTNQLGQAVGDISSVLVARN
ncbi:MAG TPA: MaoC family dehydratase N-terminal domain-containing protein [Steroidobacter sp.]|uniref:MaoC family dehydratase N-terminal domain-containing protein n=1 Tax=Steroidobacter sp. TaxID=1978227 RepID=UPI002EDA2B52